MVPKHSHLKVEDRVYLYWLSMQCSYCGELQLAQLVELAIKNLVAFGSISELAMHCLLCLACDVLHTVM